MRRTDAGGTGRNVGRREQVLSRPINESTCVYRPNSVCSAAKPTARECHAKFYHRTNGKKAISTVTKAGGAERGSSAARRATERIQRRPELHDFARPGPACNSGLLPLQAAHDDFTIEQADRPVARLGAAMLVHTLQTGFRGNGRREKFSPSAKNSLAGTFVFVFHAVGLLRKTGARTPEQDSS